MSSKLKIFQYHNLHLYNLKQYRIALEVGVYNSRKGFLSVLGSNQRLVWEFKKWLPISEQYEILAEITNRPASYFMDDLVDYYVDF